ncbi:MAG: type II toxin-antitoxin system ParD family antitoxin [Acidobacteria bacterium]|nr:type II toxin-antitoxin system ParD family antitoxin [Acidobacteriota bacterium]
MATVTISMPESLKTFIDHEVETKGYGNVSEYIRGLLRDAQEKAADKRLETLLREGLESGPAIRVDDSFWARLRAEATDPVARAKRAKARAKK